MFPVQSSKGGAGNQLVKLGWLEWGRSPVLARYFVRVYLANVTLKCVTALELRVTCTAEVLVWLMDGEVMYALIIDLGAATRDWANISMIAVICIEVLGIGRLVACYLFLASWYLALGRSYPADLSR
jgi:hypothetical protein